MMLCARSLLSLALGPLFALNQASKTTTSLPPSISHLPSSESDVNQKKNLRHAEKHRISTCRFADDVARLALATFRELKVEGGDEAGRLVRIADVPMLREALFMSHQTVMAAFVVSVLSSSSTTTTSSSSSVSGQHNEQVKEELRVVSIGVGTKVVSDEDTEADENRGVILRDNHAEVLARRGLMRFLYSQLELGEESWIFKLVSPQEQKQQHGGERKRFKVREGLFFHLYTSSAPCGNACVRRWARVKKEVMAPSEDGVNDAPLEWRKYAAHPPFHFVSPEQVAVTRKSYAIPSASIDRSNVTSSEEEGVEENHSKRNRQADEEEAESSTTTRPSCHASCSDKIARWTMMGLEGALLRGIIEEPVPLSSVVIGRKFCRPHAQRALCCRLWKPLATRGRAHPSIMCTSVKLDEGAFEAEAGARFTNVALMWAADCEGAEVLDSSTGRRSAWKVEGDIVAASEPPSASRSVLLGRWEKLMGTSATGGEEAEDFATRYRRAKTSVSSSSEAGNEYCATLRELFGSYLKGWPGR